MTRDSGKAAVPDVLLERYRLNEVSPAERAEIERRLEAEAALRDRLAEIGRSDDALRDSRFPDLLAMRIRTRAARGSTHVGSGFSRIATQAAGSRRLDGVRRLALPAAIALAAVLVVVAVGSRTGAPRSDFSIGSAPATESGERIKGLRPSLTMFRQTSKGSESLSDRAVARQGDVVRLAYQAAGEAFGVIVSIDGRGSVTIHLPPEGGRAARLGVNGRVLLDQAYELDDAPRWECFYFVTAQQPFDVEAVVAAAKREAAVHPSAPARLQLPAGLEQSMFVLQKEHRP